MPPRSDLSTAELESLLRFYAEAGVDCLLEDEPIDRFAETVAAKPVAQEAPQPTLPKAASQAPAARAPSPASAPMRPAAGQLAVPDEAALLDARAAAAEAQSLDALREIMANFTGCNLRYSAKNLVFADGNPEADIMFVGEAPGREEDIQGLPFVGRAGQLLDRMLAAIALDRTTAYITNMIPWRPPGNRNPTPHELELCRPFIERHIALAAPKLIVFLGNVSNKALMNTSRGILSARGTWGEYPIGEGRTIPAMPTLHPAYLLRNP
ncbi:MAG TPA: uracil-DNA glycosylase, partial [Pararhizobium sp.]|nr:uracil-DNA glycosylase [Pararhizobium sp.]